MASWEGRRLRLLASLTLESWIVSGLLTVLVLEDASLNWIQQNIGKFGGDKSKVVMFVSLSHGPLIKS